MDAQKHALTMKHRRQGVIHFGFFFVLIVAGIVTKRVFGHPEFMMLFHGPAAIFLVISGMHLTWNHRQRLNLLRKRLEQVRS